MSPATMGAGQTETARVCSGSQLLVAAHTAWSRRAGHDSLGPCQTAGEGRRSETKQGHSAKAKLLSELADALDA